MRRSCAGTRKTRMPGIWLSSARMRATTRLRADVAALGQRLEADEQPAAIDRGVEAGRADRGAQARHRRVGQHDVHRLLLQLQHGVVGNIGRGLRAAENQPGVVLREIALRHLDKEPDRQRDGGDEDDQRQRAVHQHEGERAVVEADHARQHAFDQRGRARWRSCAAARGRNRRRSSASPTATPRSRPRWRKPASPRIRGTAGRQCRP